MAVNTVTELNANYKILYADRLKYLQPENFRYIKDIKAKKGRLGKTFNFPLVVKNEQGFTYAAAGAGEVTFNATEAGKIEEATANGSQLFGWCGVDYETAAKGANSKQAFVDSVGHIVESLFLSANRRIEVRGWYGQSGIGIVSALSYTDDADATNDYITITTASWASSIWVGAEGAHVAVLSSDGATAHVTVGVIHRVDIANKRIYLKATDGTELDDISDVVAGDLVYFYTSAIATPTYREHLGIHGILNSAATTFFGIANSNAYSLLVANSYDVGGTVLSLEGVQDIAGAAIAKGMEGKVNLYLNPATVAKMITDLGGLRRFLKDDGSKYVIGANDIQIECQGILVSIVSHPFIWEGFGYMFNPEIFSRVQAYPLSSKVPGRGDDLFQLTPGKGSYTMQVYNNEVSTCDAPCQGVRISGIIN